MCERQLIRVQQRPLNRNLLTPPAIRHVADKCVADVRHVDANLMRAAGVQGEFHQCTIDVLPEHPVFRQCGPTTGRLRRHFFPVTRAPADLGFDPTGFLLEYSAANRLVNFSDLPGFELRHQTLMRRVGLRHHQAAARAFVEPVNDTGARNAADAGELATAVMQKRVDKRVFEIAGSGMHDDAGGFVEHDQVGVLVQNVERNFFRQRFQWTRWRNFDAHFVAGTHPVTRFDRLTVDEDLAVGDYFLQE